MDQASHSLNGATTFFEWATIIGCYGLIIGSYIAVIALYVWVFKQVDEMKRSFHSHEMLDGRHTPVVELVRKGDCDGRFTLIQTELAVQKEDISETRKAIDRLNTHINQGFDRVISAIEASKSRMKP